MDSNRRNFIKTLSLATGAMAISGSMEGCNKKVKPDYVRVSQLKKPVAIAMWDFSWILRHHKYGEFEDWDQVLQGLVERGYNAIRIDAMPQFVAADTDGTVQDEFRSQRTSWTIALWGNQYSMSFRPRQALLEFLPKCEKYGIKVGLASWFMRHGTERDTIFMEKGGLLRAWDETLSFLRSHDLLKNVMYVDLLNEYPNWHGYDWLKDGLNKRSDVQQFKLDNPDANLPGVDDDKKQGNELQQMFYNDFINDTIIRLKEKCQDLDFFASLDTSMALDRIDLSNFNAVDYHLWFEYITDLPGIKQIHALDVTIDHKETSAQRKELWTKDKSQLIETMKGRIANVAKIAKEHNIVCGNTEGWGSVNWYDHPELGWDWIKECAEVSVDACLEHENYKFICTSNFTHPHFKGMWEDIAWHKAITSKIKAGSIV